MSDLTREQIEEYRSPTRPVPPGRADAICDMALRTLDAEARIRELEAGLRRMLHDPECDHQAIAWDLLSAEPEQGEPNQCDGCRRGLPTQDGIHMDIDGYGDFVPVMACTADRYKSEPAEGEGDGVIHEAAPISPAAWEAAGSVTPPQRRDALEDALHRLEAWDDDTYCDSPHARWADVGQVRRALSAGVPDGGEGALLDDPLVDDLHDVLNELKAFADQGAERTADPVGARSRIGWLSRAIRRALSVGVPESVYQSAVKGRADFRAALRQERDKLKAVQTLPDDWRTRVQEHQALLNEVAGEVYQAVGVLLSDAGRFDDPDGIALLDACSYLAGNRDNPPDTLLPFESKGTECVVPEAVRQLSERWRQCVPEITSAQRGSYMLGAYNTLIHCADELDRTLAQSEQGRENG